ncbi:MAG TPA: EAL domain-containing response regulator, partial [Terracidiphilus sp.]|nr:EAL domain-containing response regulator [Terracidiphilus sp.]
MTTAGHILVIDDNFDIGEIVRAAAESLGMRCTTTTSAADLPQLLAPDVTLILLDLVMPKIDGIEALRMLSKLQCKSSVVLMSGISKRVMETAEKLAQVLDLKIAGHLQKPFRLADVERLLEGHAVPHSTVQAKPPASLDITDQDLRSAALRNEFVLYYQPQIDLRSGLVDGLEALARWLHPERGVLAPDCFIPRLEAIGEIDSFGWQMAECGLAEACRFAINSQPAPRIALNV